MDSAFGDLFPLTSFSDVVTRRIRVFGVTEGKTIQLRTSLYSSSIPCMKESAILLSLTAGADDAAAEADRKE